MVTSPVTATSVGAFEAPPINIEPSVILASSSSPTASSASIALTTFPEPIAVTPAFVMVTSPVTATSKDLLFESPINIFPSFN